MAVNKEKVMAAAQKYAEKGQYDKALKEYLKVTAQEPRDVRVLLKLGDVYAKKGDKQQATDSYLQVAGIYSQQGFFRKAVAVYKQVLRLDPRLVDVNFKLANLYKQLGLLSDAMQQYELASNFLHREGRVSEALEALRHMVEMEPENVASRIKLAEAYSKNGSTKEAIAEFTQAADFLRRGKRFDDFIKVGERLIFFQPENRELQRELAELYIRRNDPKRALPKLQVCFKADPRDLTTLSLLAQAFQQLNQLPKTISVLKELARVQAENGDMAARDDTFRKILELAPGDADALAALAPSRSASVERMPSVRVATPIEPEVPETLTPVIDEPVSGAPLLDEPVVEEPVEMQDSAPHYVDPEDLEVVESGSFIDVEVGTSGGEVAAEEIVRILTETDVYIKYGLYDKAVEHVRRVFDHDPGNVEAREKLRDLHVQLGEYPQAAAELVTLATQLQDHRPREAALYAREATELDPANAMAQELLRQLGGQAPVGVEGSAAAVTARSAALGEGRRETTGQTAEAPDTFEGVVEDTLDEVVEVFDYVGEAAARGAPEVPEDGLGAHTVFTDDQDPLEGLGDDDFVAVPDQRTDEVVSATDPERGLGRYDVGAEVEEVDDEETPAIVGFGGDVLSGMEEASSPPYILDAESRGDAVPYPVAAPDEITRAFDEWSGDGPTGEQTAEEEPLLEATTGTHPAMVEPEPALAASGAEVAGGATDPIPRGPVAAGAEPASEGIEDELDQADFLLQQGLPEDAKEVLEAVLERYPGHPLVLGRLAEMGFPAAAAPPEAPGAAMPPAMEEPEPPTVPPLTEPPPPPAAEASPAAFVQASTDHEDDGPRAKLGSKVDSKDFETHYDLGIAYKEMGLYNDAIREFELIAEAPGREVLCHTMIGLCYSSKGMQTEAIGQFKKGLYVEGITDMEAISLYYELGGAYEKLDDPREALYYYEKVEKRDPKFRDVQSRASQLRRQLDLESTQNREHGGNGGASADRDPEVDAALDDIVATDPNSGLPPRN